MHHESKSNGPCVENKIEPPQTLHAVSESGRLKAGAMLLGAEEGQILVQYRAFSSGRSKQQDVSCAC